MEREREAIAEIWLPDCVLFRYARLDSTFSPIYQNPDIIWVGLGLDVIQSKERT